MSELKLYQQLRTELSAAMQFLPDKPEENADSTLHALWHKATGYSVSAELAQATPLTELNTAQQTHLHELLRQRYSGTPLSHLTERQCFMGLEMLTGPQALVPRKETELLARAAIEHAKTLAKAQPALVVMDICTGSGNVALTIANAVTNARVFAADLSDDAVALARRNAALLQLSERVELRAGDLLTPFDTPEFLGKVDLLSCNPPYISSAKVQQMPGEIAAHEPHLAFDGGPFGVAILMRLLQESPRFLRSGGWLVFEVGLGQGPALVKHLEKNAAFTTVHEHKDHAGHIRALSAQRC